MKKLYIRPEVETITVEQADMLCVTGALDTENDADTPGYAREIEVEELW